MQARKAGVGSSLWGCVVFVFTFIGSIGVPKSQSAGHLDFDFSRLACWCSGTTSGQRRLTPTRQYTPARLRLFSKWPGLPADLCTSSVFVRQRGIRIEKGRDEVAKQSKRWEKRQFISTRVRRMKRTACTRALCNQGL